MRALPQAISDYSVSQQFRRMSNAERKHMEKIFAELLAYEPARQAA